MILKIQIPFIQKKHGKHALCSFTGLLPNDQTHILTKYKNKKKLKKHRITFLFILVSVLMFWSCSRLNPIERSKENTSAYITKTAFLLNTVVTITIYDKQEESLLDESMDLIRHYEKIYSRTAKDSELYALNHSMVPFNGKTRQISNELSQLLAYGLSYSKLSEGAFDISTAPISSLWNFTGLSPILPSEDDINNALQLVNYEFIQLNGNELSFSKENIRIDLGAIAKGYIADRVKEYLQSKNVKSAMINLGGNILCIGNKPDGSPFHIGIQKPFADRNETIEVMKLSDVSVVSSGIYERFFSLDGKLYHHILNPETGYPYENDLISVTIISNKSVDGDGLSTSCFALGLEKGLKLLADIPDTYGVFITKDYEIIYSEGFHDAIELVR
ncbi:FAD:protein FMN transferase [Mobilitalea sibirica]|uniref:FAD:protein FMN transferase n=2 Tax=Mobilitalea sibirica TaxID=1462919 RepID=A0A8J7H3E8_9FIRM|nr:FAD:protein FMN transferase [Mobilitalea sibirica]MBH1941400.1 FAD:protein FMN transferase [Mobilitalea sibirica]